ncbi:MAG: FtsB family cell division protein [Thermodesulfovibrionales bacterium]
MSELRRQVLSEIRKRRLIFFTFAVLTSIYIIFIFVFGESGLIKYIEMKGKKVRLEREIKEIEITNEALKRELQLLKENPFYIEKYAREEFRMAKPDEYIFRYER